MAKSKHSAALFEVITRSRPLNRPSRGGFFQRMANWFRTERAADAPAPVYRSTGDYEPPEASSASEPPMEVDLTSAVVSTATPAAPAASYAGYRASESAQRGIAVDRGRREIAFRMSYMSAGIACFALLTALALAFLIGQKAGAVRRPALGAGIPEIGPADNNVFDVKQGQTSGGAMRENSNGSRQGTIVPATQPTRSGARVAGRNYIIVQSYPELKTANDVAKLLTENGVECTVVENVRGWRWPCVVTVDGYTTMSGNREFEAQMKKIRELSDKFVAKPGKFKALDPIPRKWVANTGSTPTPRARSGR